MYKLQIVCAGNVNALDSSLLSFVYDVLVPDDGEMRLMRQQGEHDKIGVRAVEAMARVRVIVFPLLQITDAIQHLMFTFSWDTGV